MLDVRRSTITPPRLVVCRNPADNHFAQTQPETNFFDQKTTSQPQRHNMARIESKAKHFELFAPLLFLHPDRATVNLRKLTTRRPVTTKRGTSKRDRHPRCLRQILGHSIWFGGDHGRKPLAPRQRSAFRSSAAGPGSTYQAMEAVGSRPFVVDCSALVG